MVSLRGLPPHRLVALTVSSGPPPDRVVVNEFGDAGDFALIHHGNLWGYFDPRDRAAVESALADLH
jgi:hypothetical protein